MHTHMHTSGGSPAAHRTEKPPGTANQHHIILIYTYTYIYIYIYIYAHTHAYIRWPSSNPPHRKATRHLPLVSHPTPQRTQSPQNQAPRRPPPLSVLTLQQARTPRNTQTTPPRETRTISRETARNQSRLLLLLQPRMHTATEFRIIICREIWPIWREVLLQQGILVAGISRARWLGTPFLCL